MYGKFLDQCLAPSNCSINSDHHLYYLDDLFGQASEVYRRMGTSTLEHLEEGLGELRLARLWRGRKDRKGY